MEGRGVRRAGRGQPSSFAKRFVVSFLERKGKERIIWKGMEGKKHKCVFRPPNFLPESLESVKLSVLQIFYLKA